MKRIGMIVSRSSSGSSQCDCQAARIEIAVVVLAASSIGHIAGRCEIPNAFTSCAAPPEGRRNGESATTRIALAALRALRRLAVAPVLPQIADMALCGGRDRGTGG